MIIQLKFSLVLEIVIFQKNHHFKEKMPQSGVGSMQVLAIERTHRGGAAPTMKPNEQTHIFSQGGTHPQCNLTNGHTETHVLAYVQTDKVSPRARYLR